MTDVLSGYRSVLHAILLNGIDATTRRVAQSRSVVLDGNDTTASPNLMVESSTVMMRFSDFKETTYKYFCRLPHIFEKIREQEKSLLKDWAADYTSGVIKFDQVYKLVVEKTMHLLQDAHVKRIVFVLDVNSFFDCIVLQMQFNTFLTLQVLNSLPVEKTRNVYVFLGNAQKGLTHSNTNDALFVLINDFPGLREDKRLQSFPNKHFIYAYADTAEMPPISAKLLNLIDSSPPYVIAYRWDEACSVAQQKMHFWPSPIDSPCPSLYDFFKCSANLTGTSNRYNDAPVNVDKNLTIVQYEQDYAHAEYNDGQGGQGYVLVDGDHMTKVIQKKFHNDVKEVYKQLKMLDSEYIIKFSHIDTYLNAYVIVKMERGFASLEHLLHLGESMYTRENRYKVFHNIASAMLHLHQLKLAHNDLKPANIVLHDKIYKLIDFDSLKTKFVPEVSAWADQRETFSDTSDFYSLTSIIAVDLVVPFDALHIRHSYASRHVQLLNRVQLPHVHPILQDISNTGSTAYERADIVSMLKSLLLNHDKVLAM